MTILYKRHELFLFSILVAIFAARTLIHLFATGLENASDWVLTQWAINYEYGLVKRGLPGQLLLWLDIFPIRENIYVAANIITLVGVFAVSSLYLSRGWLFGLCSFFCSGTIQHIVYDRGRFDAILLTLFVAQIYVIKSEKKYIQITLVPLFSFIGILIHEAYAIIFFPMVIGACIYFINHGKKLNLILIFCGAVFAGMGVLVVNNLTLEFPTLENLATLRTAQYGSFIVPDSLNVIYRNLNQNFFYNISGLLQQKNIIYHIQLIPYLGIIVFTFYAPLRKKIKEHSHALWILLPAFSPLLMYFIATDYFRWWSIALINFFIALSLIDIPWERCLKPLRVLAIVIASLICGPLSIGRPFTIP